jgi:hypothetical protein
LAFLLLRAGGFDSRRRLRRAASNSLFCAPDHTSALGGFAKFERELIKARRDEGRKRAIERGVKMGRKAKLTPHQVREAIARRDAREPTREIARSYAVDHATICRLRAAVSNVNCNGPTPLPYAHARSKSGDDHGPRAD